MPDHNSNEAIKTRLARHCHRACLSGMMTQCIDALVAHDPLPGVTMATSLVSLFTGRPVRSDTAMTGEITLAGLVLPIGGLKEKVLAAHRAGISRIVLPEANRRDLAELDAGVRAQLEFIPAADLHAVFAAALTPAHGG